MPKIFEYLGIVIFFYSNEHEPIHVHARFGEYESKAEFIIEDGEIFEIRIKSIKGFLPLQGKNLKHFETFLEKYGDVVVKNWIDYFVLHKNLKFKRITKKIK